GHEITFYEPDIYERQKHRDIEAPNYCRVIVYPEDQVTLRALLREASEAAGIIKARGVGAFDEFLEYEVTQLRKRSNLIIFWDVDAPATLDRIEENIKDPFRDLIPEYDFILTYGGGQPVIDAYIKNGARKCIPIYNALDTDTHFPVEIEEKFKANLAFLGN